MRRKLSITLSPYIYKKKTMWIFHVEKLKMTENKLQISTVSCKIYYRRTAKLKLRQSQSMGSCGED